MRALVVVTHVSEKIVPDLVFSCFVMRSVDKNPWDVCVRWRKALSLLSNNVLILNSSETIIAREHIVKVGRHDLTGALFDQLLIVRSKQERKSTMFIFNALNEFELVQRVFNDVDSA